MNFMIRAAALDELKTALGRFAGCRVVSIEQRILLGIAFFEATIDPAAEADLGRPAPIPLPLRALSCPKGHTAGYKKSGACYRCIECRRINSRYYGAKRRARRRQLAGAIHPLVIGG
jgi:hypothetical protein